MNSSSTTTQLQEFLERKIQFLSPNEPITPEGIQRVLSQLDQATSILEDAAGTQRLSITLWDQSMRYGMNDIVLFFRTESTQVSPEVGKREFAFVLVSTKDGNTSMPNYDMVDGIPDFRKSNWRLLNPMSYLLQDVIGLRKIVKEVLQSLLADHVKEEHQLAGSSDVEQNLVRVDYTNLRTSWDAGDLSMAFQDDDGVVLKSNGVMEVVLTYGFDSKANQEVVVQDRRHYLQKSPIWDESDHTIFSRKYIEDDLFSVVLRNGTQFSSLRYGTNVFNHHVQFSRPFVDSEYMVFFDTYGRGDFVFGYDKGDLMAQTEPTYDAVVSRPMLMNKSESGFDVVLPIHTYLNSIQKFQVGVPWKNSFRLQAIGRYR